MNIVQTGLEGLLLIQLEKHLDHRGSFTEILNTGILEDIWKSEIAQINIVKSAQNVIRGLHCQIGKYAQQKLILTIEGQILDVAVDLRPDSPTYGKHFSIELSDSNTLVYIPIGFAHGYSVLSESATVLYVTSNSYSKEYERGIIYNDVNLSIDWQVKTPILSEKDQQLGAFKESAKEWWG